MNIYRVFLIIGMLIVKDTMAVSVNDTLPDCQLKQLHNLSKSLDLKQDQGKVQYIDFWASWCGPCAKSFPYMNHLHNELKNKGLKIIAVNLDEDVNDANNFLTKLPADFVTVYDQNQQCAKSFDVQAMPSTYLVDKQGVVRYIHLGFKASEIEELQFMVNKLLAEH